MEPNGLGGGMFSKMGSSGMPGLEMSLHHPHHQNHHPQPPPNPHHLQPPHPHHPPSHPMVANYDHPQAQSSKQSYPFAPKAKNQQLTFSDEDEPGAAAEDGGADGKRKNMSPWQRMKWTDGMVKLLIMVVFYIGDEAGSEGNNDQAAAAGPGKKKVGTGGGAAGGVLQKKGKWKSVSRAMLERGFYVSPQQCEDKFNDLNKRYKRVNDILGKGTACRVVENQSLLETMDLSPKMKEEAKKLLNSKHLFFREMCAYHASCANSAAGAGCSGGAGGVGAHHSPEVVGEPSRIPQQKCLHSPETDQNASSVPRITSKSRISTDSLHEEEDDDDDYDEDGEDDDDYYDEVVHQQEHEEEDGIEDRFSRKKARRGNFPTAASPLIQQFGFELRSVIQDGAKSVLEKSQWVKARLIQLEEERMGYQFQAFELEKQRVKWLKFSSKKEREMKAEKLTNERMRLENERMVLLRQKELELLELQQAPPSSITG